MLGLIGSLFPILFLIILVVIRKVKVNKKLDVLFYGTVMTYSAILLSNLITVIIPIFSMSNSLLMGNVVYRFIYMLIIAGFVEELVKYIAIKCTKPRNKNEVIINSLFVAAIFTVIEDLLYVGGSTVTHLIKRMITPGHILFQLIMILFLVKAIENKDNKKLNIKYNCLGLLIPMVLHGLYDTLAYSGKFNIIAYVLGILTYVFVIFVIFKHIDVNNKLEEEKSKFKFIKIPVVIFGFFFVIFAFFNSGANNGIALNTETNIDDILTITVVDAENTSIETFDEKEKAIKVGIKVKNKTNKDLNDFNSSLILVSKTSNEKVDREFLVIEEDSLDFEVKANSAKEGYVYFKTEKDLKNYQLKYCYSELAKTEICKVFDINK